ncbi:winged helix-turn-helix domain-containing protein, partial [Mediterraneibacter sp.]|uniref:winged helix-turn-helix domain-containing protein n=1 Tax=Mediterraneibacter sp. TaxID=2316022 RepID=UPI001B71B850
GGYYGEHNTVNVHVSNLRKKIKEADPENEYIRTVYGIGFKLVLHSNKTKFEAVI